MAITPAPSRAGTSVKSRCSKTGTQPRQHGEANPGTVRAFHEEARAVRLTSPAAEAAHSKCAQARFESGVSLDRGVALNGEKSAPRYSRPGSRPGPSGRAMPDTAPDMRTNRSRGAPHFTGRCTQWHEPCTPAATATDQSPQAPPDAQSTPPPTRPSGPAAPGAGTAVHTSAYAVPSPP